MRNNVAILVGLLLAVAMATAAFADRTSGGPYHNWQGFCGMMGWTPKPGVKPEALPDASSREAKVFAANCSQCHALPTPARHSAQDWEILVERMAYRMKMSMMSWESMMWRRHWMRHMNVTLKPPTSEEKEMILSYLKKHSMRTLDERLGSLTADGLETYKRVCSQCHAPADPTMHTKDEWPDVVSAMKNFMKKTYIDRPTDTEELALLNFLGNNAADR